MKTIPAIFENGIFRPESAVSLPHGLRVDVILPDLKVAVLLNGPEEESDGFDTLTEEDAQIMLKVIEEECEKGVPR